MERCFLSSDKDESIFEAILTKNNSICLGKVKNLELELFAINILPKLKLHEENEMEEFSLNAEKDESIFEAILTKNNSICLGKVNNLELKLLAISILPKLKLHEENEMEEFSLSAGEKEYVSEVIRVENNSIWLGRVKNLRLESFAIRILPKLKLHEENEMEVFHLSAGEIEHFFEVMFAENNSIWLGRVKRLKLESFTVKILPKLQRLL
ncbi:MAG: uncharacterized protein A8A55_3030 [Amphiamblys sp. WSBS2006]|nr:MAG: uncharacterized protein A8A55_3030 [Amphiamblys sp. WSBS2006]